MENKEKQEHQELKLAVNISNLDTYLEKAKQYVSLLKEAKTLAEELASVEFEIEINQNLD